MRYIFLPVMSTTMSLRRERAIANMERQRKEKTLRITTVPKYLRFNLAPTYSLFMPMSGAKIANQFAIVKRLLKCRYMPNIIGGTSGGCVVATTMIGLGIAEIKSEQDYLQFCAKLTLVLNDLDSTWYCTPHSYCQLFCTFRALQTGYLFDRGKGEEYIKKYAIDVINQPETWLGTYDQTSSRHQLWCTKHKRDAIIRMKDANYLDENVEQIAKVAIASSAVPFIVPPIEIKGSTGAVKSQCDGGVGFASPLGSLMPAFDANQLTYHVVYISPVRYSSKDDPEDDEIEDDDVWNKIRSSSTGLVTGLHLPDRNNGIRAVGPKEKVHRETGEGERDLMHALEVQRTATRSFIEVTPRNATHLNFLTIKKGDATKSVELAYRRGFTVRHWYI